MQTVQGGDPNAKLKSYMVIMDSMQGEELDNADLWTGKQKHTKESRIRRIARGRICVLCFCLSLCCVGVFCVCAKAMMNVVQMRKQRLVDQEKRLFVLVLLSFLCLKDLVVIPARSRSCSTRSAKWRSASKKVLFQMSSFSLSVFCSGFPGLPKSAAMGGNINQVNPSFSFFVSPCNFV